MHVRAPTVGTSSPANACEACSASSPIRAIASWRDDGDDIEVTFAPDDHVSRFSRAWLEANMPGKAMLFDDRSERHRPPWLAADLGGRPSQVDWEELTHRR